MRRVRVTKTLCNQEKLIRSHHYADLYWPCTDRPASWGHSSSITAFGVYSLLVPPSACQWTQRKPTHLNKADPSEISWPIWTNLTHLNKADPPQGWPTSTRLTYLKADPPQKGWPTSTRMTHLKADPPQQGWPTSRLTHLNKAGQLQQGWSTLRLTHLKRLTYLNKADPPQGWPTSTRLTHLNKADPPQLALLPCRANYPLFSAWIL